MAEKLIWEDEQVQVGIGLLAAIDTPAAHAALRRFGLSQAGDDEGVACGAPRSVAGR